MNEEVEQLRAEVAKLTAITNALAMSHVQVARSLAQVCAELRVTRGLLVTGWARIHGLPKEQVDQTLSAEFANQRNDYDARVVESLMKCGFHEPNKQDPWWDRA